MTDDTIVYDAQPPKPPAYAVSFDVEGPSPVSRLSSFFRLVLVVPILLFLGIIAGTTGTGVLGGLLLAHWITVLIRGRPVGWIYRTIVAIQRFAFRAYSYLFLIVDKYPPFEGDWSVSYEVEQPERIQRKQLVIWKTLASIPHLIALVVLWFAVVVCVVIAWFAILFTGRFPLGLRGFIVGWLHWAARVGAYWMSLRDEYPPFSTSAEAGPASNTTHVWSGVGGFVLAGAVAGGIIAVVIATSNLEDAEVSYASLLAGESSPTLEVFEIRITLLGADDRYEFEDALFIPEEGGRFVSFTADLLNVSKYDEEIRDDDFELKDTLGDKHEPLLVSYGGLTGPRELFGNNRGIIIVIFEIPRQEEPAVFEFEPEPLQRARFNFTR